MILDDALRDLLRERGATEDELFLLEKSSAFLTLLDKSVFEYRDACTGCGSYVECARDCFVVEALHETDDPRLSEFIERAWTAAEDEEWDRTHPRPALTEAEVWRGTRYEGAATAGSLNAMFRDLYKPLVRQPEFVGFDRFLREQPTLDDAPAIDDRDRLDVDDT